MTPDEPGRAGEDAAQILAAVQASVQKCPICDGSGSVSRPPWVAGDVQSWVSDRTSYPCPQCGGQRVVYRHNGQPPLNVRPSR